MSRAAQIRTLLPRWRFGASLGGTLAVQPSPAVPHHTPLGLQWATARSLSTWLSRIPTPSACSHRIPVKSTSLFFSTGSSMQEQAHAASLQDPAKFWDEAARESGLEWFKPYEQVLDQPSPYKHTWFKGGEINTCFNALDRHVRDGRGDQVAVIHDSAVHGSVHTKTYSELLHDVERFAGALAARGVGKGDRVLIYMPMVMEAATAMLACARLGAIHSVVFGGFAAHELATRIKDCTPKAIISATCGIEVAKVIPYQPLLEKAMTLSPHKVNFSVVLDRPQCALTQGEYSHIEWKDFVAGASPAACVPVASSDPLYVLYTSGTTGDPKGIVRDNGGHSVALCWSLKYIFGMRPGEVWWAASDVGWVVGHSYIVYGPLLYGCTSILFEGKPVGTPDAGTFFRAIDQHNVKVMFTAPTAFRAIRRVDPRGDFIRKYDLSRFKALFLAGERLDPNTLEWAERQLGVPVIDHYWQTETGWPILAANIGPDEGDGRVPHANSIPNRAGSGGKPVSGYDVRVLDPETGEELSAGEEGDIVIRCPMPPGTLSTIYNHEQRYVEAYLKRHEGFYHTGDHGFIDKDGYVFVMSRTDDAINVSGHRLSTGAIEEVIAEHPAVAECAVVGIEDPLKGQVPLGFVVLQGVSGKVDEAEFNTEINRMIREHIGPVASYRHTLILQNLPKTRSGKVLRRCLKQIVDEGSAANVKTPPTIESVEVLSEVEAVVQNHQVHDDWMAKYS